MSRPKNPLQDLKEAYSDRRWRLEQECEARRIHIINANIGQYRAFSGRIEVNIREAKSATDEDHLHDIKSTYDDGKALAYWTDGSHRYKSDGNAVTGAGVAWQERNPQGEWVWETKMYGLGENTGSINDAELYGIASGLRLAVEKADKKPPGYYQHVRVLSYSARVLTEIENGRISILGPAVSSPWALQQVYDHTDTLMQMGVDVRLVWVKGHARSEGNGHADRAAGEAVMMQMEGRKRGKWVLKRDVPELIARMGQDSVDEWYWRVNGEMLCRGEEEKEEEEAPPLPPPPPPPSYPPPRLATPPPPPEYDAGSEDMDISDDDDDVSTT
jgi:ribonuclease HI